MENTLSFVYLIIGFVLTGICSGGWNEHKLLHLFPYAYALFGSITLVAMDKMENEWLSLSLGSIAFGALLHLPFFLSSKYLDKK